MRGKITALMAAVVAAIGTAGAAIWARGRKHKEELDLEVSHTPLPPAGKPASTERPAPPPTPSPATGTADDLTAIKGLGKVKASKLVAAGVTSYAQIAAWTDDDIAEMGLACNTSPGQIKREDWVGQARTLAQGQ
jgi:predicted flap endonuclease-1-like 5' DNA nuclease